MDAEQRKTFDRLFSPKSLAIVGISKTDAGLGGQYFLKNLQRAEYPGRIYLVNPTTQEINGRRVYAKIFPLPEEVDLAIVCTPSSQVGPLCFGRMHSKRDPQCSSR